MRRAANHVVQETLDSLLERHAVVLIAGVPRSGKSTLSQHAKPRFPVIHTDDWKPPSKNSPAGRLWQPGIGWDNVPALATKAALEARERHGRVVIEGVRALSTTRHGIRPGGVIWLAVPRVPLTPTQARAAKGRTTNWELWRRKFGHGVEIHTM